MNPIMPETGNPIGCGKDKKQYKKQEKKNNKENQKNYNEITNEVFITTSSFNEKHQNNINNKSNFKEQKHLVLFKLLQKVIEKGINTSNEIYNSPLPYPFLNDV